MTSAGWQVILCDPVWQVSSRSGDASCELLYSVYLYLYLSQLSTDFGQVVCSHGAAENARLEIARRENAGMENSRMNWLWKGDQA